MPAVKFRRRQIEQPVVVLINQPAAFLGRRPVLAGDRKRRLDPRGLPLDDGERLARLARDHRRHAGFENAGLLGGDRGDRVAEKIAMIERHARDDARERTLDHVGGVEPAAEPDFEQQHIGRMAREQQKGRRRLHLEHGDRRAAVLGFALGQRIGEFVVADELAAARCAMRKRSLRRTRLGEV